MDGGAVVKQSSLSNDSDFDENGSFSTTSSDRLGDSQSQGIELDSARDALGCVLFSQLSKDDEDDWEADLDVKTSDHCTTSISSKQIGSPSRPPPPAVAGTNQGTPTSTATTGPGTCPNTVSTSVDQSSGSEIRRLQDEISFLKTSLAEATILQQLTTVAAVKRIIHGQKYSFEKFRSKEEKLELLDVAIRLHDGNAIIAAVLFLRDTVEPHIFQKELLNRPTAVEHYICFLRQHFKFDELGKFYSLLGRTEEAAYLQYRAAVSRTKSQQEKISNLQNVCRFYSQPDKALNQTISLVNEQLSILSVQLQIEADDMRNAEQVFRLLPRAASVMGTSTLTTLYYCSLYHYNLPENHLSSPVNICKTYKLTEKQYQWTILRSRGQLRQWKDLQKLFEVKGWLGGTKMKAAPGFDRVVKELKKLNAPREELNRFCNLIERIENRLEVGRTLNCHESVIDTYLQLKDRRQLSAYHDKLNRGSREWTYANDILNNSSIKWKN